jgi:hypothetical protein
MNQHRIVYREPGRFAGWPANYGMWAWGEELVVGFTLGSLHPAGGFHARDQSRPFLPMQARSLDGGETWTVEPAPCRAPGGTGFSADEHVLPELSAARALAEKRENQPGPCPGEILFTHPDFALMCARTGLGAGTAAWFYLSADRCRSWAGPYSLPDFGLPGVEARTDYLVTGPREGLLFLTASKASGGEGAGVFCARTGDAGRRFEWLSWVTRVDDGYAIMPATVRLEGQSLRAAIRRRAGRGDPGASESFVDLFGSEDLGQTWHSLGRPVPDTGRGGNPPALTRLLDGRLVITYGYRAAPFGIRARVSADGGSSWGEERVLRADAGNHDIGYPRTAQRPDGRLVTVYYYNDHPARERYIAATLWMP